MPDIDLSSLNTQILWASFALSVIFGAVAQRTHFCTMGAVGDILNIRDWARMRMWVLAIGVAVIGFNLMVAAHWVDGGKTFYAQARLPWLSIILGGLMFGIGMALASGCGSKTVVRIGGGNLKSLLVFIVMAVAALSTMRGILGVWRQQWIDPVAIVLPTTQDLPSLISHYSGQPKIMVAFMLALLLGGGLVAWSLGRQEGRSRDVLLGGLGIGAVVLGLWWVSGVWGHLEEHPETLEEVFLATNSRRMESFTFVGPVAYLLDWITYASDKSKAITLGIVTVPGVMIGSCLVAVLSGTFRWEGFRGTEDMVNHMLGGALMGIGGVMALGCTIGQGLSGVSTLSVGSLMAFASLIVGAVLGLRYQAWRIERMI